MFNKTIVALVLVSLLMNGFLLWHDISIDTQLAGVRESIEAIRTLAENTQKEINTEIKPQQALAQSTVVRLKGQIENFDVYVSHERHRRVKIFQVREAIKKTIMYNQHSQFFKETKKLSRDDLYLMSTYIVDACEEFDVPVSLFMGLMRQESAFDPKAVSPTGAQGLAQIIPSTARQIQKALAVKEYDAFDMHHNIRFGAYYLSRLIDRFTDTSNALRAYNAGPEYVAKWLTKDIHGLPAETVIYERMISHYAQEYADAGIR